MANVILRKTASRAEVIEALVEFSEVDTLYFTDKHGDRLRVKKQPNGLLEWRRRPGYVSGGLLPIEDLIRYYISFAPTV